jgi:hypothetical protein
MQSASEEPPEIVACLWRIEEAVLEVVDCVVVQERYLAPRLPAQGLVLVFDQPVSRNPSSIG